MGISEKEKPSLDFSLDADSKQGFDSIDNLQYRVERYGRAKKRTTDNCTWLNEYRNSLGDISSAGILGRKSYKACESKSVQDLESALCDCGNWMLFHHYYNIDVVKLANMKTCKKPLMCQLCAIRRASKSLQAYLARFEVIVAEKPNLKPYFLTLTVTNGDDLKDRFNHLKKSFDKYNLRRRKSLSSGKFPCELNKVHGAVYSYELTNKDNGWHPHLHILCLCDPNDLPDFPVGGTGKQKSDSKLSIEWGKITKDSFIVDFRPISGIDGFIEVFKYALKFSDMSPALNYHAYKILNGKRLTGSFGLFRGVTVPNEMTDDLIKDEPYMVLFYKYLGSAGRYSLEGYQKVEGVSLSALNALNAKFCISESYAPAKLVTAKRIKDVDPKVVPGKKMYKCSNCGCAFDNLLRYLDHIDFDNCTDSGESKENEEILLSRKYKHKNNFNYRYKEF